MVDTKQFNVVESFESQGNFTLKLLDIGIVVIDFEKDFFEMRVEHLIDIEEGMRFLGKGKKLPFFFNSKEFMTVDKEGLRYSASPESGKFTLANAVLVDNAAKKMMYNILLKVKKPYVQTRAFKTQEDAFEWLLSIKNQ